MYSCWQFFPVGYQNKMRVNFILKDEFNGAGAIKLFSAIMGRLLPPPPIIQKSELFTLLPFKNLTAPLSKNIWALYFTLVGLGWVACGAFKSCFDTMLYNYTSL
uniref:Uncharacterized protein n=1 Tax=Cacopsylla melanoneura TaxID=428564 RepID=A0A8D8ZCE1_9HEMI